MLLPWNDRWQSFTHSPAYRKIGPKDHKRDYPAPDTASGFSAQVNLLLTYLEESLVLEVHMNMNADVTVVETIHYLVANYGPSVYILTRPMQRATHGLGVFLEGQTNFVE
ncbi:hypothetical protein SARC_08217 [Sphaeroforma arctica JP610]|uniref:Uncharacterized protein n=1 Tax=Sphaeroforma arctica JP610 TaxID=667725 RepID=A0A0L0FRJ0_9EUKA|nr:hypothetical protein SARC_08217 [Sphaeroforma arctica JP610]KNC79390.1 hypothetical protein SARC_08217 [Sphaeroforma arctica JP610]|eukprot:XP_014153292.1 hypothetical protein SARC_08217 [Sphaeroforma arctica JP610]